MRLAKTRISSSRCLSSCSKYVITFCQIESASMTASQGLAVQPPSDPGWRREYWNSMLSSVPGGFSSPRVGAEEQVKLTPVGIDIAGFGGSLWVYGQSQHHEGAGTCLPRTPLWVVSTPRRSSCIRDRSWSSPAAGARDGRLAEATFRSDAPKHQSAGGLFRCADRTGATDQRQFVRGAKQRPGPG
jgi:hypothetical protein